MATLLRKYTDPATQKLRKARTELADRYGNLYGMRLENFFVFNGHSAVPRTKESRKQFEEILASYQKARGTSQVHRARREAERSA